MRGAERVRGAKRRGQADDWYLDRLGSSREGHPEHLHLPLLLDRHGQGEVTEGVKGDGDLLTVWALHRRLQKAVETVHNDGVISLLVVFPSLLGHHLTYTQNAFQQQ